MAGWLEDLLMQGGAIPQQMAAALQGTGMRPQEGGAWMKPQEPGMLNAAAMVPPPAPAPVPVSAPPPPDDIMARAPVPYLNGRPIPTQRSPSVEPPPQPEPEPPKPAEPNVPEPPPQSAFAADPAAIRQPPPAAPVNNSPPGGGGFGGILGKIFDPANAPLLLAMGGGFAGAPSLGTGMRRGFTAAAPQATQLYKERLLAEQQNATARALRSKPGISEADVIAASQNPEYLKSLLAEHFGGWKPVTVGETPFGKTIVMMGPGGQTLTPEQFQQKFSAARSPGGTGGAVTSAPNNIPEGTVPVPPNNGIIKQGRNYYDPNEPDAQKYLDQFSPEMQQGIKQFVEGKEIPVGNPRMKTMAEPIRNYGRLYAGKAGIDVSDAAFAGRRLMEVGLKDTVKPSAIGGQITYGGTSLTHLEGAAENAVKLKNAGIGFAPASEGINYLRSLGEKQKGIVNEFKTDTGKYGQEITKFYTNSPGGVEERQAFAKNTSPFQAPEAMAGSIRGELKLLPGRFEQIYDNIAQTLGKDRAEQALARAKIRERTNAIKGYLAELDPTGTEAQEKKQYGGKFAPLDAVGRPIETPHAPTAPAATGGQFKILSVQ